MRKKQILSFFLMLALLLGMFPFAAMPVHAATNVTLTVWADDYALDWVRQRAADFNAQSSKWKLTVEVASCHVGESGDVIAADPQAAADVFIYSNDRLGQLISCNALLPITGDALAQVKADNSASMVDTVTYTDGKVYGIPYTSNTWFMYYNKDVYTENDVKSLETMLEKGIVAFPLENTWYLPAFYYANGCTMFGESGLEAEYGVDFACANGVAVTKYLAELATHPNLRFGNYCYSRELIAGNVDAFFSGTWEANTMVEAYGSDYGAAQLPTVNIDGKTCQLKAFLGSKAFGVNAYTKHPEAALAFAAFLGNATSQKQRYELVQDVPANPALADDPALMRNPAAVAQMKVIANTSVLQPWLPEMVNYWNEGSALCEALVNGEVTDDTAAAILSDITMAINQGIVIRSQPKNAKAAAGDKISVSTTARGSGLTYQWYIKNAGSAKFSKSSVTGATYTTTMSDTVNGREVYCVITDAYGVSLRTKTATLSMKGSTAAIVTQPKTTYAKLGATAKVTVKATGDGLSYQWYIKNAGATKYSKSSVTSATYSAKMSDTSKDRLVYCVITDAYGNSVKTNTVRLRMAATVTSQSKTTYTKLGATAKATVTAAGDGLTYQWYIKNAGATTYSKSSVTSATYSCKMTETTKDRLVYCVVTDKYGKTDRTETVRLRMAATVTTQPKTTYTKLGATAKVSFKAAGDDLTYTWYIKNADATKYSKSSVTSATYSCKMTETTKDRLVYCVVTDKYGNSVRTETVRLRMAATVTKQPVSVTVAEGKTAKVTLTAVGDGLTYTWYFKDVGATAFTKTSAFTGNTYSVTMTEARDGRQVYCVITDKYGKTVQSDIVTLNMN